MEKAGSLHQLGRILGYTGNAPNWNVKNILYGRQGIPLHRLKRLCDFLGMSPDDLKDKIDGIKETKFRKLLTF